MTEKILISGGPVFDGVKLYRHPKDIRRSLARFQRLVPCNFNRFLTLP